MNASLYQTLPAVALVGFLAAGVIILFRRGETTMRGGWIAPAALALLFLGWSSFTVLREGPLGFWPEHVRDAWGNQIWFDLLLSIGIGFALLVPRARTVGMRPVPWFIFILCTGSVGLLAMLARFMFLSEHGTARTGQ